ncbi:hypothetical protein F0562_001699 [Nyssa sinensis]|uniref:Endoplasmic reticulum vesicle transporter C-terminal domain-containing protein n=1 Tax=Nyssa sinensis TaxID=561372 RepID=A0A5J5C3T3_9ASTE|nr:hypothetical protein F0562_001699 [Nyssa sinensis]
MLKQDRDITTRQIATFGFFLAPFWFITECYSRSKWMKKVKRLICKRLKDHKIFALRLRGNFFLKLQKLRNLPRSFVAWKMAVGDICLHWRGCHMVFMDLPFQCLIKLGTVLSSKSDDDCCNSCEEVREAYRRRELVVGDDEDDAEQDNHPVLSAAAKSTLRPPSLQNLLEDVPYSAAVPHNYSSGADSEGKSKCDQLFIVLSFRSIFC